MASEIELFRKERIEGDQLSDAVCQHLATLRVLSTWSQCRLLFGDLLATFYWQARTLAVSYVSWRLISRVGEILISSRKLWLML